MCGIAGAVALERRPIPRLGSALNAMSDLIAHRGPDGKGFWQSPERRCGLAHRRLSIIDLSETGAQPMTAPNAAVITFNGEIYNQLQLRAQLPVGVDAIQALPQTPLHLVEDLTDRLLQRMGEGSLDAAVIATEPDGGRLDSIELPLVSVYPDFVPANAVAGRPVRGLPRS